MNYDDDKRDDELDPLGGPADPAEGAELDAEDELDFDDEDGEDDVDVFDDVDE